MFGARKFQALVSWGVLVFVLSGILVAQTAPWSTEKAATWYEQQPWLVGSNYIPNDAINELEMWQAQSFNAAQIDKELGWAEEIGMTFSFPLPKRRAVSIASTRRARFSGVIAIRS